MNIHCDRQYVNYDHIDHTANSNVHYNADKPWLRCNRNQFFITYNKCGRGCLAQQLNELQYN
jgi:hypothetical protein